jgi:hypothetical protein
MKPIFESKLSLLDLLDGGFLIIIGLLGIIKFSFDFTNVGELEPLLLTIIFSALFIQGIRVIKTFILYEEKLIIRRPLTLTKKTDVVFQTSEIKEIIFRKIKGRFGGPHILIKSRSKHISYRIGSKEREIKEFIEKINSLNIKTMLDNWTINN